MHGGRLSAVVLLLALVTCASRPKPSAADEVSAAARLTLDNSGLVVSMTITSEELDVDATEYVDLIAVRSLLATEGAGTIIATDGSGAAYLGSDEIDIETGGRWLELSLAEIADGVANLRQNLGDLSGLILRGGLTTRWLVALTSPGDTTLIGREVVKGQATSHYLTEPTIDGSASPVEVWITDDGPIVQLRYLTNNDVGSAVEVTALLSIGRGAAGRDFPTASDSVTRAELEDEAVVPAPPAVPDIAPVPGDSVTVEMVGAALQGYVDSGNIVDGVFAILELEQLCLGISDVVENGFTFGIHCERLLSPELQAVLCPTVVLFAEALVSQPRPVVAEAADRMERALDGYSELGLVSGWRSFTPDDAAADGPLENSHRGEEDLPIRGAIERIHFIYSQELEPGYWLSEENTHDMLGVTCGVELDVNWDLFDQPPPNPKTTT